MQSLPPFAPKAAATVNIDVSAVSQAVALGAVLGETQIRVMNNGSATVWINFGVSTVTATLAAGIPIGPGVTEVLTIRTGAAPYVAAIAAAASGKIYFTPGSGV